MRHVKTVIAVILAISILTVFVACDNQNTEKQLKAPVLVVDGTTVSWDAVENASGYDVFVNGISVGVQTETSYSLANNGAGSYEVAVIAKAMDGGKDSQVSKSVTVEIDEILGTPVLSISGNTVTWVAIDNAVAYEIYVNDVLVKTQSECIYGIDATEPGVYKITVRAKGSGYYKDGEKSAEVIFTVTEEKPEILTLSAPSISLQGEKIVWEAVENATTYKVFCDGVEMGQTNGLYFDITVRTEGTYNFTVVASNPSSNFVDSDPSNVIEYVVRAYDMTSPTLASSVSGGTEYVFEIGTDGVLKYVERAGISDFTKYMWYFEHEDGTEYYNIKLWNGMYLTWRGNGNVDGSGNELMQAIKSGASNQQWYIENTEDGYKLYNKAHSDAWSSGSWQYYIGIKENAFKFGDNCSLLVFENKDIEFEQKTALSAPVVSVEGTILSWNEVENASSYAVFVDGVEREIVEMTTYELGEIADGKHTAYVIALPSDFDNYGMSAPSNTVDIEIAALDFAKPILAIHKTNGGQNLVAGIDSEGYIVPVDSSTVEDFAPYMWYFEKSESDGYYYVKLANGKYLTAIAFANGQKCAQALDFSGEDNQKWGFVAQTEAGSYKIINAAEPTKTSYFGEYFNNFAFDAVCNAWNLENKDIPFVEKETLNAPQIVIDGKEISWEAVENATSYKIYVNGELVSTQSELSYVIVADESKVYKVYVKAIADGYYDSAASNEVSYDNIDLFANKVYAYYNDANQTLGQVDENGDLLIGPGYSSVSDYTEYLWTIKKITDGSGKGYYTIQLADGKYLSFADAKEGMEAHASAAEYNAEDSKQWWILVADESKPNSYKLENVYYRNYYSDVYLGEWYSSNNGNAYVYNGGCQSWTFVATDVAIEG